MKSLNNRMVDSIYENLIWKGKPGMVEYKHAEVRYICISTSVHDMIARRLNY